MTGWLKEGGTLWHFVVTLLRKSLLSTKPPLEASVAHGMQEVDTATTTPQHNNHTAIQQPHRNTTTTPQHNNHIATHNHTATQPHCNKTTTPQDNNHIATQPHCNTTTTPQYNNHTSRQQPHRNTTTLQHNNHTAIQQPHLNTTTTPQYNNHTPGFSCLICSFCPILRRLCRFSCLFCSNSEVSRPSLAGIAACGCCGAL